MHGIETEIWGINPMKPNIVAKISAGTGEWRIVRVGHLDVVPEGEADTWTREPYSGKITNDGLISDQDASDMNTGNHVSFRWHQTSRSSLDSIFNSELA